MILGVYFTLIFARRSFTATAIVITIIICLFTFYLMLDLFIIYLESRNEWNTDEETGFESNSQVIIGS